MRYVEQRVMLEVIDQKWRAYLTQMDHLREGIGLVGYGQKDPLLEYKSQAFEAFQELTTDIQRDIVRMLMHVQLQPQQPPAPAAQPPTVATAAPPSPRADTPAAAASMSPDEIPAARPAAAAASGALARATTATTRPAPPRMPARPAVRNVVESSSAGQRSVSGGGDVSRGAGNGQPRKVGRNDPCWCGSGRKYKRCHGAV